MKKVTLYTDGACSGNPGPGGFGAILNYNGTRKRISGGYRNTTNNRMELTAIIRGLEALTEPCKVTVVTDSRYVSDAVTKGWAQKWRENGWKRNKKDKALNPDLWARLLDLIGRHEVTMQWVRGHSGHPENEECDRMAVEESGKPDLPVDLRSSQ